MGALVTTGGAAYGTTPAAAATTAPPLTVVAGPGGSDSFNPFVLNQNSGPNGLALYGIYEPLYQFSTPTSATYPWLATSYTWSDGGRALTFQLRHGVKWSNGTPFTSADVAYTYNLIKSNTALNPSGLTISSATAEGTYAVKLTFPTPQYDNFYYIAQTLIVPEQQWKSVSDPAKYADSDPVGTGPFVLKSWTLQTTTLTANPSYWRGEVKVPEIEITAYDNNASLEEAMDSGAAQMTGATILGVNKIFVDRDPSIFHAGSTEVGVISLEPNLTVYPLNLPQVREAISMAINRQLISTKGEDGASPPVKNQAAVLVPADSAYLDPAYSKPFPYDVSKAKSLLKAAGLKMGSNGYFKGSNGKAITLSISDPSSYSDYISDAGIISEELKSIGLNVSVNSISLASWTADRADGDFQLIVNYSETNPNPMFDYQGWLDYALSAPVGKTATEDYGRYDSAGTQKLLEEASTSDTTSAKFKTAMYGLEKVVATDLPVIPLVYNEWHGEWSTKYYEGWPTASNDYAVVSTNPPDFEVTIVHLHPKS